LWSSGAKVIIRAFHFTSILKFDQAANRNPMTRRTELLNALTSTPNDIERLGRGLDEAAARWQPDGAAWSPIGVLNHLLAVEAIYLYHFQRMVAENEPRLPDLHPDWKKTLQATPWPAAVEQFRQARLATLAFLQGLAAGDWQRAAIDQTNQRITVRFLGQRLVEHDIEHTNQLVELIQAERRQMATQAALAVDNTRLLP
jgi:hypothetical protein